MGGSRKVPKAMSDGEGGNPRCKKKHSGHKRELPSEKDVDKTRREKKKKKRGGSRRSGGNLSG